MFEVLVALFILAIIIGVCGWFFDQIVSPVFGWLGDHPIFTGIFIVVIIVAIGMCINAYSKAESKYRTYKD